MTPTMMPKIFFAAIVILSAVPRCVAAELIIPPVVERNQSIAAVFQTGSQATGKGQLQVDWTDVFDRVVESRAIPVALTDEREVRFSLDGTRAVAMQNTVKVHFSFDGLNRKGEKDHREEDAAASFVSSPPDRTWWDYMVIMWQGGTAEHFAKLQKLGVNAGKSSEHSMELPDALLRDNLRWYVENMATDFYSAYHIYRPDRPYNDALLHAKEQYKKNPESTEALKRFPSFSDPFWLNTIHDRLVETARRYAPYRPIFYNLADETGIAELAGFWDFDFSDYSLDGMRRWLKGCYGTLAALNEQWKSSFASWDLVTPETTREAMKRTDGNYSSWADHKEWMDLSFANALQVGVDAVRSVDPEAYVAIEGAQMPGWGGYDYARLSTTLQALEPYDIGDNIEIIRSINPRAAFVTTSFATGPWEKHRLWYELLHGARGHIIWDEKNDIVQKDGKIGPRGTEVSPDWNELRSGIGALLINSIRQAGPIAIHYSQASMRAEWMLQQRPKGDAWMDRMSWTERKENEFLALRDSYCRLIEDQGMQYNFVAYDQVEAGELLKRGYRVLILPKSSALSSRESQAMIDFVKQGGVLVVDGDAGTFDEHCRRLPESSLRQLFEGSTGRGRVVRLSALAYRQQRVVGKGGDVLEAMHQILTGAGVRPSFTVEDAQGRSVPGIETHEFRNGGCTVVGLLSNPPLSVDDLGPPEFHSYQHFEQTKAVKLVAPTEFCAYDLRRSKPLGRLKQLTVKVDPYEPVIIALSPTPMPDFHIDAPQRVARGGKALIALALDGASAAATHVFHLEILNPEGQPVTYYSGNVLAPNGSAGKLLPFAKNEPTGKWTIRAKDLISGQEKAQTFEVE